MKYDVWSDRATRRRPGLIALRALGIALFAVLALGFALPRTASADDSLATKQIEVERQLGCPICTNLPLNVCDNQLCQEMRGVIRQKLQQGETPDQVVAYFVSRYGDAVLLAPPRQGFSLAAWYLPFLALLGGAAIFLAFLRRSLRRRKLVEQRFQQVDLDPALDRYRQQVRHDLATWEDPR